MTTHSFPSLGASLQSEILHPSPPPYADGTNSSLNRKLVAKKTLGETGCKRKWQALEVNEDKTKLLGMLTRNYEKYLSEDMADTTKVLEYLWVSSFHPQIQGRAKLSIHESKVINYAVQKLDPAQRKLISCVYRHFPNLERLADFASIKATHEDAALQAIFETFKEAGEWTPRTLFEYWRRIIVRRPF
jgi:hypothetical protein